MREVVPTEYGDVVYENGEPTEVLVPHGDVETGDETGGVWDTIKRHPVATGLAVGAVGLGAAEIARRAVHASRQAKREQARIHSASALSTLKFPLITGDSVRFGETPLSGSMNMVPAVELLALMDRAASNTPSPPIIKSQASAGGAVDILILPADLPVVPNSNPPGANYSSYFFPIILIEVGTSALQAQPAQPFYITKLDVPTESVGKISLVSAAGGQGQLIVMPSTTTKRSAIMIIPWLIVDSGPHPLLGAITGTGSSNSFIEVAISGLADPSTVTVTLTGTTHELAKRMRHYLRTGVMKQFSSSTEQNSAILAGI